MAYCVKCGQEVHSDMRFCSNCGNHIELRPIQIEPTRKEEYAGKVVKCPSCGQGLPSMTAICPSCGHEINSASVSDSLKAFVARINECDMRIANSPESLKRGWSTWSKSQRTFWVILNIFLYCIPLLVYFLKPLLLINKHPSLTNEERQKVSVIENFTCPNDRGSILESMLFVRSKVFSLASGKINNNCVFWVRLWVNKAKQLHQNAELLFAGDKIANDTYQDIINNENKVKKILIHRFLGSVVLIVIAISLMLVFVNRGSFVNNNSPTIQANSATNDKQGVYSYKIRNYVGKNVASIGKESRGYQVDEYGSGELKLIFVTDNGLLVSPNDTALNKQYSVVAQSIKSDSVITVVHLRDSSGRPYSNLVDYQSCDEIVLFIAPIGTNNTRPTYTDILPTLDRHHYHIRDYVGRNAASFGEYLGEERIDKYGNSEIKTEFTSKDGSFVDAGDINVLKEYIVVEQDIKANSELNLEYETDSNGREYDNLIRSQNHEIITLTLERLDDSVIAKMPVLSASSGTSSSKKYEELTIEYKVLSDGKAEITGYSGTGNCATINSKIDGHEVIKIGNHAFEGCTTLESIVFWAAVEEIGDSAFKDCTSLDELSIPHETIKISDHAFEGCTNLKSVAMWGDSDIGEYAFARCTALPSISVGYNTKNVGAHAFDGCTSLKEALIWNNNTVIGKDAFANCPNLKNRPVQK